MDATWLDTGMRKFAFASITGYQKYISPYKGFACAHRLLYGGESCSQYVKRMMVEKNLRVAIQASKQRFRACKKANRIIRASIEEPEREESPKTPNNERKRSDRVKDWLSDCGCTCGEVAVESIDCADCSFCEFSSCELLNCGSAIDCSGLDCGSCSFLSCS